MFKNLQVYRLPRNFGLTPEALEQALASQAFTPATSMDLLRQGWDAPRRDGALVHAVGGQFLLQLKSEKKLLPASVITQVAAARALELEEAQGFAPGKKAMKELKERVADELLPRAFSITSTTNVWIDPVHGWLVVDAASPAKADEVIKLLLKAVDKLPLENLRVQRSPVAVMTEWLQADDAPAGFTVDQDAVLCATGESKAQVAYKRGLAADDVRKHIAAGKQCTRLAMTWRDKISFVLDESLAIKSVKALDVLVNRDHGTANDDERFDSDFAMMTGEFSQMLADIVEALGGEATVSEPGEPAAPRAAARASATRAAAGINKLLAEDGATATLTYGGNTLSFGDGAPHEPANLYDQAVAVVLAHRRASISLVQRHLHIGYNRAARLLEQMEAKGVVGQYNQNGERLVICSIGKS